MSPITGGHWETFGGDGNFCSLDVLMVSQIYTYVKSKLYTLNMCNLFFFSHTLNIKTNEENRNVKHHSA